jgi:hypothetical protein
MVADDPKPAIPPEVEVAPSLEEAVHGGSAEVLKAAALDPGLNEDLALALLKQNDLSPEVLEQLSKNGAVLRSRKVKLAIVGHPKTPRYVSVAIVRQLFTFDLMRVALAPLIPGDIKMAAEEALIRRLEAITPGERLSLARRASGRVAGVLLLDPEARVIRAALENPRLTEALIVRALAGEAAPMLVQSVCHHPQWSLRQEIRIALLRNRHTPLACAMEFARTLPAPRLKEILQSCQLPESIKSCLLKGG